MKMDASKWEVVIDERTDTIHDSKTDADARAAQFGGVVVEVKPDERTLTPGRIRQGFKSQAHLDAFYAGYDHGKTCPACNLPGEPVEVDDGMQPTMARCAEGRRLDAVSFSFS